MDAEIAWQSVVAEVKSYNRFATVSTRLNQLRNEINGLSAYTFQLRVFANKLSSRTLIMGVRDLNNYQRSAFQGSIDALDAHNAGFFTTQFLVPIEADISDMFRVINDCLRREIQVIRRNL